MLAIRRRGPATLEEQAWHSGNAKETPHIVGTKKPNAFGLYDMLGNVAEWTFDLYSPRSATRSGHRRPRQPVALPDDKRYPHPTRGGSFIEAADKLRYANRQASHEDWSQRDPQVPQSIYWHTDADHVGFRVARALDEQANLKGFKSKVIKESADRFEARNRGTSELHELRHHGALR